MPFLGQPPSNDWFKREYKDPAFPAKPGTTLMGHFNAQAPLGVNWACLQACIAAWPLCPIQLSLSPFYRCWPQRHSLVNILYITFHVSNWPLEKPAHNVIGWDILKHLFIPLNEGRSAIGNKGHLLNPRVFPSPTRAPSEDISSVLPPRSLKFKVFGCYIIIGLKVQSCELFYIQEGSYLTTLTF